jgi:hypothetical protein
VKIKKWCKLLKQEGVQLRSRRQNIVDGCVVSSDVVRAWRSQIATPHVTRHNMPIHNILSTAPQLSISQKALGTLPDDGIVMPKHVGDTIYN